MKYIEIENKKPKADIETDIKIKKNVSNIRDKRDTDKRRQRQRNRQTKRRK